MEIPADPGYHDRKTGLVVFGILEVVIGCLCVLAILLMLLARLVTSGNPNAPVRSHAILQTVFFYGSMAVTFIWLGVGSIEARRWARALLLCLSAVGLVFGLFACATMAFMLPHLFDAVAQQGRAPLPPAALTIVKVVTGVFILFFYVIIPGALFLFYRSPHVKRTCEIRDPVERWTDRCPLPVLAFGLFMGIAGITMLGMAARFHGVPMFGFVVPGVAGFALGVMIAGLLLCMAYGLYRLDVRAWWTALGMQVIFSASGFATYWRGDYADMYLRMGIDQRSAAITAQLFASPVFTWMMALSVIPWLAWLIYIRRYFGKPQVPPVMPSSGAPVIS